MVSQEQADEIRRYLIAQLEQYGFGDITREVTTRIEERLEDNNEKYDISPRRMLTDFLTQSIDIFETLSNSNFEGLMARFREYVKTENGEIETFYVQPSVDSQDLVDLKNLPDYKEIIVQFQEIRYLITSEN
jgi:hypothetical protein